VFWQPGSEPVEAGSNVHILALACNAVQQLV
jgi:hypothetical protein